MSRDSARIAIGMVVLLFGSICAAQPNQPVEIDPAALMQPPVDPAAASAAMAEPSAAAGEPAQLSAATQPAATQPAAAPAGAGADEADSEAIESSLVSEPNRSAEENRPLQDADLGGQVGDWLQTVLALGLVVALIFAARWALKKRQAGLGSVGGQQVVEVLNRTAVSARQSVLILRVGKRILVVGAGADGMSTLTEISDAEEISAILGAVEQAKSNSLTGGFVRMLQGLQGNQEPDLDGEYQPVERDEQRTPAGAAVAQVQAMLARVRGRTTGGRGL